MVVSVAAVNQTIAYGSYAASIENTKNTAGSRTFFNCRNAISALGNTKTTVAFAMGTANTLVEPDLSGNASNDGGYNANTGTLNSSFGCKRDSPQKSVDFNGSTQCLASKSTYSNPQTFSLEAWFQIPNTATKAAKVIGFGATKAVASESSYDRHVYVDETGRVVFGIYMPTSSTPYKTISTPAGTDYSNGAWHHVVATYSSGTGMKLYVDDKPVVANATYNAAENTSGYWKVGCGNLSGWPNAAGTSMTDAKRSSWFTGQIQYSAVYSIELSATQVIEHYNAGKA